MLKQRILFHVSDFKISLITVCYNAENTITNCIESVIAQDFNAVEYIIIDGGSSDKTINIINNYKHFITHLISEPDKGIYDAMNKGIKLASGNVIGMLNADDSFTDNAVLKEIAGVFEKRDVDVLYADLDYVNADGKVVRKWRSGQYSRKSLNLGWMPPHPTFYCKRNLFDKFGFYSLDYGTAADYELMIRFLNFNKLNIFYLKKVIVRMKMGGKSNKSIISRVKGLFFDLKAMRANRILLPVFAIFIKPLRKVSQYF